MAAQEIGLNLPGAFGQQTSAYRVPASLFAENRARLVKRFVQENPAASQGPGAVFVFKGGEQTTRHDTDHEPVMRQESFFSYLFGVTEADCYAAIEVPSGKTTLFVPRLPKEYAVWMGTIHPASTFASKYELEDAKYVDELVGWLDAHPAVVQAAAAAGGSTGAATTTEAAAAAAIHVLWGVNSDSGNAGPPLPFDLAGFEAKFGSFTSKDLLKECCVECRVLKSSAEVELMQRVNDVASDAHLEVIRSAKPGMFEYQVESLFRHHCYYNGGMRHAAYTSICGCGPSGAVLHYGHAGAPNERELGEGEIMLCDMGVELRCYCCDITCSFPIADKFSADQTFMFETVALCQAKVMKAMKPGVQWADMHELTYRTICERFTEYGLLVGPVDAMVAANVGSFFMPHGLGHLIGVDTHDVGGYPLAGGGTTVRDPRRGFKSLRMQRKLEAGMVLTVEPGVYFIDSLLDDLLSDPEAKAFAVADRLNALRGFGGVRLEDSLVVLGKPVPLSPSAIAASSSGAAAAAGGGAEGSEGCFVRNLTTCPRTVADVEGIRAGTITRKDQLTRLV